MSGTDKIGLTEEILVEPRHKARIQERTRVAPAGRTTPHPKIPTAAGGVAAAASAANTVEL